MMIRRRFLKSSGALTLGALLSLKCKAKAMGAIDNFGVQLWSVRHLMEKDPKATLKSLADIGFVDVESAGYVEGLFYGMTVPEMKTVLLDLGLKMRSVHTKTGITQPELKRTMTNEWEAFCKDNAEMGVTSVVCGYFEEAERQTLDDYKRHADLFNTCGEKAKEYGLSFGHHNHDFEFFDIDGETPYDILLNRTEKDLVMFELDHYWIKKGGKSTLDYFDNHPGRFHVWHVKDMDNTKEQFFTEVGSGIINWKSIFNHPESSTMQYFYVEQDEYKKYKPLESLDKSYRYLRHLTL